MGSKDPRVDAYIAGAAPFAQPILARLRAAVHAGCPRVNETIKWGMPFFEHQGVLCSMAAFKSHCAFGFWHSAMRDAVPSATAEAMGQFGRITRLSDLPGDATLKALVRKAAAINATGVKSERARKNGVKPPPDVPDDLAAALATNAGARAAFEALGPAHRREYIEWIVGAKRHETRAARLATALEWMSEGKVKEWRYPQK